MARRTASMSLRSPNNDLGAEFCELLGTLIGVENEGPYWELSTEQLPDDMIAGCTMSSSGASDQKSCHRVLCHKCPS